VVDLDETALVDVTADQLGYDQVLIITPWDPRYRASFAPAEIEDHLIDGADRVEGWFWDWTDALDAGPRP
jgi:hypothetical protein